MAKKKKNVDIENVSSDMTPEQLLATADALLEKAGQKNTDKTDAVLDLEADEIEDIDDELLEAIDEIDAEQSQQTKAGIAPDDEKASVGEVGEEKDRVHQGVAYGDEGVHRSQRQAVDDLLQKSTQRRSPLEMG